MNIPKAGEVWFVDLGMVGKPRWCLVLGSAADGRLAVATVVLITTQFDGTPYEVSLPRVPWLREQSHTNAQSLQPVKFSEFTRKAPGQFDARIISDVKTTVKLWLKL